jgi:uncharacterized delta-60 repeat protein
MKRARITVSLALAIAASTSSFALRAVEAVPQSQPGSLDLTFDQDGIVTTDASPGWDDARDVSIQPDGKVLLAGSAGSYGVLVTRYNQDGTLDQAFGDGGVAETSFGTFSAGEAVDLQDDGSIVVAGFTGTDGNNDLAVVKFLADGSLDASFGGDGIVTTGVGNNDETSGGLATQGDGKFVVAGTSAGLHTTFLLARYLADGSLDSTFGTSGLVSTRIGTDSAATDIVIQPDGRIIAVGSSTSNTRGDDFAIVRYKSDGSRDDTFGTNGVVTIPIGPGNADESALAVGLQADGRIVTVGYSPQGTDFDFAAVRLNPNGTLDTAFGGDGIVVTPVGTSTYDQAADLAIQADGRTIAGGSGGEQFALVRYLTDGSLDNEFGDGGIVTTSIGSQAYARGVAIGPDGKIILAGETYNGYAFDYAAARYLVEGLVGSRIELSAPARAVQGEQVDISGTLIFDDSGSVAGRTVHITRTNPDGSATSLPDVVTDALGSFSASDVPVAIGSNLYSARFDGDQTHDPAVATSDVVVISGALSDFDGDGYGDLAVGVPWEDFYATDGGAINVIYGSTTGLTATGDQWFDEVAAGFTSDGEADGFGYSLASGDFNGDGFGDLAASAPGRTVGSSTLAGTVGVLYGSAAGLTKTSAQQWTQDSPDIQDAAEPNDFFGWAVSAGDLNGDGYADLSVGVPGETVDTKVYAGGANVIYGSPTGLVSTDNQFWSQNSTDINGKSETDDEFGLSVAIGDFTGDGFGDLAVGAPLENLTNGDDGGSVNVIYGSAAGLVATGDQLWDQDSTDINDKVEKGDYFGYALGAGDFDGDGFDDLIAGVPAENLTNGSDGGAANVIYGTSAGLSASGDQFWNQDKDGINDKVEKGDEFGAAVSAGDFNGDGHDDAVFGIPWEDIGSIVDGGAISVIYGTSGGLDDPNDDFWKQDSTNILDSSEASDLFGYSVVAGDFGNGPEDDVAVGVPLEGVIVSYQGAVNLVYGSPALLTDVGNQFWNQDSPDIEDHGEFDDEFGFGMGEPGTGGAAPVRTPGLRFVPTR